MSHLTLVRSSALVSVVRALCRSRPDTTRIIDVTSPCESLASAARNSLDHISSTKQSLQPVCLRRDHGVARLHVLTGRIWRENSTQSELLSSHWHRTGTRPLRCLGFDKRVAESKSSEKRLTNWLLFPARISRKAFTFAKCALFAERLPLTAVDISKEAVVTGAFFDTSQLLYVRVVGQTRPLAEAVPVGAQGSEEFALTVSTVAAAEIISTAELVKRFRKQSPIAGFLQTREKAGTLPYLKHQCFGISSRQFHVCSPPEMAKSKFEYVRQFETDDPCLPNCWVVVRIDGKAFHKFTDTHHYMKPNDERGLSLMTRAAQAVMSEFNEIVLSYGQSDEYSFVFHKTCKLYNRRASKIMTNVVSLFASSFTLFWPRFFNSQELQYPPSFDGRVVLYPSDENLGDYLSWRQADCHINNLYNTCFWKLVQEKGLTPNRAADRLKGTLSSDKNELLYSEFNINYNNLPELFRKGSVLIRPKSMDSECASPERSINNHMRGQEGKASKKPGSIVLHTDIIGKQFWEENPHILNPKA